LEQCQGHVDGFLYHEGVIHHEYAPSGQTLTKMYIIKVLCQLRDAIRRKQQHFWANGYWQFHHNNVPAHSSALMQAFVAKRHITQVCQISYSPDLALCNFWLF
jgi:hypothetical protein